MVTLFMRKSVILLFLFILLPSLKLSAQNQSDNTGLYKVWTIAEFIENGKKYAESDMVEVIVDFREDGTYIYWEENDSEDGVWEMTADKKQIVFDKGTDRELIWDVVSIDETRLEVKFTSGKSKYKFTFVPKEKRVD